MVKKTILKKVIQFLDFKTEQNFPGRCRRRAGGDCAGKGTGEESCCEEEHHTCSRGRKLVWMIMKEENLGT